MNLDFSGRFNRNSDLVAPHAFYPNLDVIPDLDRLPDLSTKYQHLHPSLMENVAFRPWTFRQHSR